MKIGRTHTLWITLLSALVTGYYSCRSVMLSFNSKAKRAQFDTVISKWVNHLLNLVQVKCNVINPHNVMPEPGKATIIMCNHTSLYDIPISFKAFPNHSMRMLAKKELSTTPFLGRGMKAAEFPFIDRKNRHQAVKDLAIAKQLLESGIVLWVAPEGTRSMDGKLAAFKKGAFITAIEANATIIPIGIRGAYEILPAKTLQINLKQTAEVHIGRPIDAAQYTMQDREILVETVHKAIEDLIKV